ncbi:MAG: DNA repair exonuclease [Candidatus Thermoplasmatota archaeon]|nr:DNA repair exonuclease [Candidatus Thermoplasmatota archaeon]
MTAEVSDAPMVRMLHTSDWHMGLKAVQIGEKAGEVRKKRYQTASLIANIAKNEKVDFVIISGDTFDNHNVDDSVVRYTIDILNGFSPIPVLILPGNHDPLLAGGVWDRGAWKHAGKHITLMAEEAEKEVVEGTFVYPCPVSQKLSSRDPTYWIPERKKDECIRIGIAHGSLRTVSDSVNFPIPADRADISGLDYLALGDWHSFRASGRTVYSGTHEQTTFGESDAGNIVIVDIGKAQDQPKIERRRVGQLKWFEHDVFVSDETDVERMRSRIFSDAQLSSQLLRISVRLDENIPDDAFRSLSSLRSELMENALYVDWPEESMLQPLGSTDNLPPGLMSDMAALLHALSEGKTPDGYVNYANTDKQAVLEAMSLLKRLSKEGNF